MSKATVITSDAMARQEDESPEVKTVKTPTVESVVKRIAKVREDYGTPSQAEQAASKATVTLDEARKAEEEARDSLRKSEKGLRAWQAVAHLSEQSGQSAREFGRLSGGNPNTRARLLRARSILMAAHSAKVSVPFWQAVADGNGATKHAESVVVALANGENPYAKVETTETGKARKAPATRRPKVYKIADAAETVRAFTALVPKDETLTDAQWADLDKAARAFVVAVSKRAGTAPKRATRKAAA